MCLINTGRSIPFVSHHQACVPWVSKTVVPWWRHMYSARPQTTTDWTFWFHKQNLSNICCKFLLHFWPSCSFTAYTGWAKISYASVHESKALFYEHFRRQVWPVSFPFGFFPPLQARNGSWGSRKLRHLDFSTFGTIKVVRSLPLRTGRLHPRSIWGLLPTITVTIRAIQSLWSPLYPISFLPTDAQRLFAHPV